MARHQHDDLFRVACEDQKVTSPALGKATISWLFDGVRGSFPALSHKDVLEVLAHNYEYAADALEGCAKHLREQAAKFRINAKKSK